MSAMPWFKPTSEAEAPAVVPDAYPPAPALPTGSRHGRSDARRERQLAILGSILEDYRPAFRELANR